MAMNMGMNGVNHWVTNVCELLDKGKYNETEIEICLRWTELAAFLPQLNIQAELVDLLVGENKIPNYADFISAMK